MNGKFKNGIAGLVISGMAIMATSCGGSSVMDTGNTGAQEADQQALIEQVVNSDEMPSLEKISSDWQQWGGDLDFIPLDKHQSVGYGLNELDETRIFAKSDGVYNFENGGQDFINFPATDNGFSYAVFGLKDIPVGAIIRGIHFTTDFNSSESDDAEYYVAYSNYESGNFQWYGPFAEGEIEVFNLFTNTVNVGQKGYFTIAVTGNNYFSDVADVEVVIGNPVVIDLPLLYERQPIPNWWVIGENGKVDWDLLWKRPGFERLGIILQIAL